MTAALDKRKLEGELARRLAPIALVHGLEVLDVECEARLIRVTLDDPAGPLGSAALDGISPEISVLLDGDAQLDTYYPGAYMLEVSSPGVERSLRTPAHFARFVGSKASIRLRAGIEGPAELVGMISAADDEAVSVAPEGAGEGEIVRLSYPDIERARTIFEWPSSGRGPRKAKGSDKK